MHQRFSICNHDGYQEWPKWVSWSKEDPALKYTTGKLEISQGASFSFVGPKFGSGSVELNEAFKDSVLTALVINDQSPVNVKITFQIIPERKNSLYLYAKARSVEPIPFIKGHCGLMQMIILKTIGK